ncbi:Luciferase-like monooxygenase [Labilithrix luteola]|uniref:Luciferase-like monooxygenase n=1 Tax=Labilithrix luteola TaxID=1391654 RepID=A0A0K1PPI0_9BACT|nr:LLM class flavin-dependent oxidoreductase [Labilithrix luteola]AKU95433.1 Luciferase-like monooxygenase [Labilithrix luteola]
MTLLSVLDLTPVPAGASASVALQNTLDLARHADALGLTRYWLAEHHNASSLACSAPEIMIGQVAAVTRTIRVGAGGIMLPNHSSLKVAEVFRVLSALFPGRIDLGIGRAAGTDPKTALALRRSRELLGDEAFPAQVTELRGWLDQEPDPNVPFGPMKAVPAGVQAPPLWILGSSEQSASFAGERGLGYAFAHHMNPEGTTRAVRRYLEEFRPSAARTEPHAIVALPVVCGMTDPHAEELASSSELSAIRFGQGFRDRPLPTVDEARAYAYDADERALLEHHRAHGVVGDKARVGDALRRLVEESGASELMVMTAVHDHAERKRSYERVAEALGIV